MREGVPHPGTRSSPPYPVCLPVEAGCAVGPGMGKKGGKCRIEGWQPSDNRVIAGDCMALSGFWPDFGRVCPHLPTPAMNMAS